jgi:3D-(3,5/4)-trihydroxycyclohexane-1,2-dione acylhydrolase (decyclizing)
VGRVRVTAAQALVRFLAAQRVERDGVRSRFFGGCFGIFGHGNLGVAQALLQYAELMPYHQGRNEPSRMRRV